MTAAAVPPLWREARVVVEIPELLGSRMFREPRPAEDAGLAVLLIPGVYAPDATLSPMAAWLKRMGYAPKRAGIRFNADCSEAEMVRLQIRLERAAERSGPTGGDRRLESAAACSPARLPCAARTS